MGKQKTLINQKNEGKEGFKWTVMAVLHREDIENIPEHISKIACCKYQYN